MSDSPHAVDVHVGLKVRTHRAALGLTQSDLATALGITFQQVQKYERGANRISASKLWQIAETLNVPISTFFVGLPDTAAEAGVEQETVPSVEAVEIARRSRQLTQPRQRLVLELIREYLSREDELLSSIDAEP